MMQNHLVVLASSSDCGITCIIRVRMYVCSLIPPSENEQVGIEIEWRRLGFIIIVAQSRVEVVRLSTYFYRLTGRPRAASNILAFFSWSSAAPSALALSGCCQIITHYSRTW